MSKTICITGASGYIASHIVKQLLAKGHTVKGTVRDASNEAKIQHLLSLPGAETNLQLFSVNLVGEAGRFDAVVDGCDAVLHTATAVLPGNDDGKALIFTPAMEGTQELLNAVQKAGCVKTFVLTSSMSAVAPKPEPLVKSEAHWSDDAAQEARGNWYGVTKTRQEKLVAAALKGSETRFVAICPTGVFGPMLQPGLNTTMGWIAGMAKNGPTDGKASNDSMSFVDVRDVARHHVAGVENEAAEGRYMSIAGTATERKTESGATVYASTHWNEVYAMLKEINPSMPDFENCDGEPVVPTSFDLTRTDRDLLPIKEMHGVLSILKDSVEELKSKGHLN